ncbi:MAG TPA: glycosyltransferase [Lysobacter sp.]
MNTDRRCADAVRETDDGGVAEGVQPWLALVEQIARTRSLGAQLGDLQGSISWRMTAPLRALRSRMLSGTGATPSRFTPVAAAAPGSSGVGVPHVPMPRAVEGLLRNMREPSGSGRLLVDVSEVDREDLGAGIQRVTKRLFIELLCNPPDGMRVVPVRLGSDGLYRHAWRFCERLFGVPQGQFGDESVVGPLDGDTLLGLDLCRRQHEAFALALQALRASGTRVLIVVYDLLPHTHPQWFPEEVARDYQCWLRLVAQHADVALCISNHVRTELVAAFSSHGLGFSGRMELLPLGADGLGRPGILIRSATPRVLMVGTVEPRKGHSEALGAFEQLWKQGRRVELVVAGRPGWKCAGLHKRIRRHRYYGSLLHWYEAPDDVELTALLGSSDLLLMASLGEGYGLPIAEAGRAGCRLLLRDLPVFREVARDRARYFSGAGLEQELSSFLVAGASWPSSQPESWPSWRDSAAAVTSIVRGVYAPIDSQGSA